MKRGTLMVLKRLFVTALGALGLSALAIGPVAAQEHIPAPELLGTGVTTCLVSMSELETQGMDPRTALDLMDITGCGDADDQVGDFREAHSNHAVAQRNLAGYIRTANLDGRISTAEEQRIAFLTDVRDNALAAKNEHLGNALAEAVYAEQDAIAALRELDNAISGAGGINAALKSALLEHHNFVYTYTDDQGAEQTAYLADFNTADLAVVGPDTSLDAQGRPNTGTAPTATTSIVGQLTAARTAWNALADADNPYDDDGNLKDFDDLTQNAKDAAVDLAVAERRLAAAKRAASAQVTALANARTALEQGQDAVEDGEEAVRDTMKTLADRAAGAGDNAASRLAQVRATRQKAYDDAAEDLDDAQEDLDDAQDDLDELEDDLDDAESDLSSAIAAYEAAVDDVDDPANPTTDEQAAIDAAAAEVAAADKEVQEITGRRNAARTKRNNARTQVEAETMVANEEKKKLDEALSGSFEFTAENPAGDLLDALVQKEDTGGALVDAVDAVYQNTASNKAQIDANSAAIEGLDTGAIDENAANIATNTENITALDGRVAMNEDEIWDADGNSRIDMNETRSMENRTMIMTNTDNIATNTTMIGENRGMIETNAADILTNTGNIAANSTRIGAAETAIGANTAAIADNMNAIGQNRSSIMENAGRIGELSEDLDIVRSGVAAAMALAGMPAINGRGVSIGVGSFDGESAFAVGFQIQGEMASFKVGVTSSGGETGASAGVGFQF